MFEIASFIFSVLAFVFSLYSFYEVRRNKGSVTPLNSSLPSIEKKITSSLPPLSPVKEKKMGRNGESFIGKNVLGILATIMIAIGAIFLGSLAGSTTKVVLIFVAGIGMGVFGYLGEESAPRISTMACGEVLVFISIVMAGAYYKLFSEVVFLALSVAFAIGCYLITLKKKHPILSFSANAGLLVTALFCLDVEKPVLPLMILFAISSIFSLLASEGRREINLLASNVILCFTVLFMNNSVISLLLFSIVQIAEFAMFKHFDSHIGYVSAHIALWSICNMIILIDSSLTGMEAALYAGISLALACITIKAVAMIRGKDNKPTDLGLIFSLFGPLFFRFAFEEGTFWHMINFPLNYFALILFGIPGIFLVWGFAKKRNKCYTIAGSVLLTILSFIVPISEINWGLSFSGGGWVSVPGLSLSDTGRVIWSVVVIIGACIINFYMRIEEEDNRCATLITVIGAYLSVYMFGSPNFALLTAVITLLVSAMQYYLKEFRLELHIVSHLFGLFVLGSMTSGSCSEILAFALFAIEQASTYFIVRRAIEENRTYIWVSTLLRFNLFVICLASTLGCDLGFILSGILLGIAAVLIYLGFAFDIKAIRSFGLWELVTVVIKMCLYDIGDTNVIVRVVAFMGGGVLCLAVSSLYNKYEKKQ